MELINRITQGDCLEVMQEISDGSVDMILTDIPYNEVNRKSNGLRVLDKGVADELTFDLPAFLEECYRISKGSFYIFCGISQVSDIRNFFADKGISLRHCVWHKTNPSPMNGQHIWLSSIENCIFAKKPNATFNQKCKHSTWDFPVGRSKVHPTEKPLKLFEYLIESSSDPGDIIFDPCSGSGTTAVAALNTNRNFICIEKEPKYVDLSRQRLDTVRQSIG
jgi:DNA modification methylase